MLSYVVRNCNFDAFDRVISFIEDPNIPDDTGQRPLLQAVRCAGGRRGDNMFKDLLNHSNINRQTSPPPLIRLMVDCHASLVPEVLKFNDTIVNFRGTLHTDHENYLHDYLSVCDPYDPEVFATPLRRAAAAAAYQNHLRHAVRTVPPPVLQSPRSGRRPSA